MRSPVQVRLPRPSLAWLRLAKLVDHKFYKQMNSFHLKIAACLFMLVDHVGALFFPDLIWLRVIGRFSFPLFAYLLAIGFTNTSNVYKYLGRLLIFALVSQPIFYLAFPGVTLNIFVTLFLGLVAIFLYNKIKNKYLAMAMVLFIALLGELIKVDYGWYGVLFPISFYWYISSKNIFNLVIWQISLNIFFILQRYLLAQLNLFIFESQIFIQFFSLVPLFFIKFYNGQIGRRFKYVFYAFYPGHLLFLILIKYFI